MWIPGSSSCGLAITALGTVVIGGVWLVQDWNALHDAARDAVFGDYDVFDDAKAVFAEQARWWLLAAAYLTRFFGLGLSRHDGPERSLNQGCLVLLVLQP